MARKAEVAKGKLMDGRAAELAAQIGTQRLGELVMEAVLKLNRYALPRDREVEREPRTVTLTDDEGAALLFALDVYTKHKAQ